MRPPGPYTISYVANDIVDNLLTTTAPPLPTTPTDLTLPPLPCSISHQEPSGDSVASLPELRARERIGWSSLEDTTYSLLYTEANNGLGEPADVDRWSAPDPSDSHERTDMYSISAHQALHEHHGSADAASSSAPRHSSSHAPTPIDSGAGSDQGAYRADMRSHSDSSYHGLYTTSMSSSQSRESLLPSHYSPIEPSSGPERAIPRRQRAALRKAGPEFPRPTLSSSVYSLSTSSPPQSPSITAVGTAHDSPQDRDSSQHLQLSMSTTSRSSAPQTSAFPTTPGSHSPSQSHYDFFPTTRQTRSNSLTNLSSHAGARSPSPALSLTSEATSGSLPSGSASTSLHSPLPSSCVVPSSSRPKQRKQRLFNVDRKEICRYHNANPHLKQDEIAQRFQVERSTISKILKYKDKWLHVPEQESMRIAKHRPSKFPEIEEYLVQWLSETTEKRKSLTDVLIRNKAKELAKSLEIPEEKFKASSGWVENFKHRHGIRRGVWHGDGRNVGMARALGSGTIPDTALSPLNPAFVDNISDDEDMDEYHPVETTNDPVLDHDDPHHAQILSPVEHRSWDDMHTLTPHDDSNTSPPPPPPPYSQDFIAEQESHQGHHSEALAVQSGSQAGPYPLVEEDGTIQDAVSASQYQHIPTDLPPPATLRDAETSINTLIEYLDGAGASLTTPDEREALNQIKCALFAHGNDLPYTRPPKRNR